MTLKDLQKDVRTMSDEELLAKVLEIRKRRASAPVKVAKAAKQKAATAESKALNLLKALNLSEEELKELMNG